MAKRDMSECPFKVGDKVIYRSGGWGNANDQVWNVTRVMGTGHVMARWGDLGETKFHWSGGKMAYQSGCGSRYVRPSIEPATEEAIQEIRRRALVSEIANCRGDEWQRLTTEELVMVTALVRRTKAEKELEQARG